MDSSQARTFAIAGFVIELALPFALIRSMRMFSATSDSLSRDTAIAAAQITQGAADAMMVTLLGAGIAAVGLIFFGLAIWQGRLLERWVFWLGIISSVLWFFWFGFGTLIGLAGFVLLMAHRRKFFPKDPDRPRVLPYAL